LKCTVPFVYVSCGAVDPRFKCDLYNASTKHCIASKCIGFDDESSVRNRVTILFNLIRVMRRLIRARGECHVNKTRDAIDSIPILSLVGIKAFNLKYTDEYFFFCKSIPSKNTSDFVPIDYGRDGSLEKIKSLAYYTTLKINLASFNSEFGNKIVSQIKTADIENYQVKRKKAGYSDNYVDHEVGAAKAVVNKAFDNDMVTGETVKVFKRVKKLLKRNANAQDRILSLDEFGRLMEHAPWHIKAVLGVRQFLLRGLEKVRTEWLWVCTAYNITRLLAAVGKLRAVLGCMAAEAAS
jgi:hypothetical protein